MTDASTGVPATGGVHCETTTLGALLGHAGVHLPEPMLFGLGSGLSFVYWDSKRQSAPFLGGRVKPFELTRTLARRLGLDLRVQETSSARRGWDQVRTLVDDGVPVGLQLDRHDLERYLLSDEDLESVTQDNARAHRLGVNGVPSFVFDGPMVISGAQEPQILARMLDAAASAA